MAKKPQGDWQRSPDWRNEGEYPVPRSTSLDRWACEFLARNADFQKAIKGIGALTGPRNDPNSPFRKRWSEIAHQFGIAHALLPEWGFDSPVKFERAPHRMRDVKLLATGERVFLARYQEWGVAFLFDLRQSIDKQLATAKKVLRAQVAQDKKYGLLPLPRTQRNRNPDYRAMLRVLDGLDTGAIPSTIAAKLFPGRKAARDLVKALRSEAERLRDGGYRYMTILRATGK